MTRKHSQRVGESDYDYYERVAAEKREMRRRAKLRAEGVSGNERKPPGGFRRPDSEISKASLARRLARDRAKARLLGLSDISQVPHKYRSSQGKARTPEPDSGAAGQDDISGLIKQLIPDEPARDVIQEWQNEGIHVKFFRGGNRWWIQAHDRVAPVDDFLTTVKQEIERAKDNG